MATRTAIFKARGLKIRALLLVFLLFVFVLAVRLFYLQIDRRATFSHLGKKNFLRIEIIPPLRGDVYDSSQVLLAANRPVFDLYWQGRGISKITADDESMLKRVGVILGVDFLEDSVRRSIEYADRYSHRMLLRADVTFENLCQISEQCADTHSLVVANRFKRVYPYHELASHVLGYLNRGENVGQAGIELKLEQVLQGQEGRLLQVINSTGKTLAQRVYKEARAGADLTLTIDFKLQQLVESLFEGDQAGVFILMDPVDGAIRALVSYPRFDPNVFLSPLSQEDWEALSLNNPLLNRATSALYPPASTFKLVTLAAGLEEHIFDQGSEIECNGYTTFCGRKYYCMKHTGHGKMSLKQALVVSCNIPCFHIARKLKIDRLAMYAQRFGLGQKTNFLLPEKSGLVPTTAWKKAVKGERWWKGETLSASIGQSYLMVTPLQIARMVGSICTGWLIKPRLLAQEEIEKEPLVLSHDTISFLRSAMKEVVANGTCRKLSFIRSFDVFAKTGTAQTCSLSQEKLHKYQFEHAWLCGYFSYKGQKPLVMVALLENAGSSHFAVDLAAKFLVGYRELMESNENA
jgi:penicillin-binding protein 2